jgi:DNA primase
MLPRGPYQAASPQLALSPIMRGQRSALSRREALILQCLINHPWLLHDHLEEVAALELSHPEAHKLRAGIIAAYAHYSHTDDPAAETARLRSALDKSGYAKQIQLVERALTTKSVWGAQPGAGPDDVISTWHQLVALHHKAHALLRERKDAELALSQEPNEANFAWLKDVSTRLESMDGTEALIEGFGEQSGRFQRSM